MKKHLIRTLCLLLCVLMCPLWLSSCGDDTVFSLGSYEIEEDEYRYLISMFNRNLSEQIGFYGYDWTKTTLESGSTIADYVDSAYTSDFLTSVYTLLYCQLLFDIYELKMPQEMEDTIESNVQTVIDYYGAYSEQKFNQLAKLYGFNADTLREVYTMQMKQTLVVEHLFGADGEKITSDQRDDYYKEKYMCFQTIVINNKYKTVIEKDEDGKDKTVYEDLTDDERKERNDIIDDLTNLFVSPVEGYTYKVIDPTLSYEQLYALYSDDKAYPNGCYTVIPSLSSAAVQNAIAAAAILEQGDVAKVVAKRYFSTSGTIQIGGSSESINAGDYFEYGYVFVKRLPLGEKAYEEESNKDFFGGFLSSVKSYYFSKFLSDYEKNEAKLELDDHGLASEIPLSSVKPNDLDYNFIYGELSKESSSSK